MQTLMKLKPSYSSERFIVTSGEEHENMLANFIAAVASGAITIETVRINYPDSELFIGHDENYLDHCWETVSDASPSFHPVKVCQEKSPLLLRLEAKKRNQEKASKAA